MAPTRVAGDLYADIDGQILEIKRQLRQRAGYPHDPMQLVEHLQAAIDGNLVDRHGRLFQKTAETPLLEDTGTVKHIIDLDAAPYVPEGWQVEEHIKGGQFEWDPAKVVLYLSESQKNDGIIGGNQLREELKGRPVYNANLLDYLLAHSELIPGGWIGKFVFFLGTIYRYLNGFLYVHCLRLGPEGWGRGFVRLDHSFDCSFPAAVPAST